MTQSEQQCIAHEGPVAVSMFALVKQRVQSIFRLATDGKEREEFVRTRQTARELLKYIILSDCPELKRTELSEFSLVSLLREWSAAHTPWTRQPELLLDGDRGTVDGDESSFYQRDVSEIYAAFLKQAGAVWCGGSAHALCSLYRLYGFDASTLNIGFGDSPVSHVVTLVSVRDEGRAVISIQDAYFNQVLVDGQGRPLDYFDLIKLLSERKHDEVKKIGTRRNTLKPVLSSGSDGVIEVNWGRYAEIDFLSDHGEEAKSLLTGAGYPYDLIYLHHFILGGAGLKDSRFLRGRLDLLKELGVKGLFEKP